MKCFEVSVSLVYLNFVARVAGCLAPCFKLFHKDEPLIYLHERISEFVQSCMKLFIKGDIVQEKEGSALVDIDCEKAENWL